MISWKHPINYALVCPGTGTAIQRGRFEIPHTNSLQSYLSATKSIFKLPANIPVYEISQVTESTRPRNLTVEISSLMKKGNCLRYELLHHAGLSGWYPQPKGVLLTGQL